MEPSEMDLDRTPPPLPQAVQGQGKDNVLLKLVLGGCGCLMVIAVICVLLFGRIFGFTHGPTRVVEFQLKAINSENYSLAYGEFSRDFQARTSLEEFRNDIRAYMTLLPYKSYSLNRMTVNNDKARVEGTIIGRDGAIIPVRYDLIRERGKWKITNYEWTSPGERQSV